MRVFIAFAGIALSGIVALFACDDWQPPTISYGGPPPCAGPTLPPDGSAPLVPPDPHAPPPSGSRAVFAITKLYLGVTLRDGTVDPRAWATYGSNIDGRVTTRASTDVCRLALGSSKSTQADACNGTDNSFSENIVPILVATYGENEEQRTNDAVGRGTMTNLIVVEALGTSATQSPLRVTMLVGAARADDGMTWSVRSDSLVGGDASSARLAFGASYLADRLFVAGPPSGDGLLAMATTSHSTPLILETTRVTITATLSDDGTTLHDGTISGIIPLAPLLMVVRRLVGEVSDVYCSGSAFGSIAQQISQTADILADGTQDPNRDCDGISFGIGFDARLAALGSVVDPPMTPDPCVDGGTPDAAIDASAD